MPCTPWYIQLSLQVFIAMIHWSGLRLRNSTTCSMLATPRTLRGHSVGALCCGHPAALGLWVRFLHMVQQIVDGMDVGLGQVITLGLGLGLGSYRAGPPDGKWELSHAHCFWRGSPTPPLTGPDLLCCPGGMQGLLFRVFQVAIRANSHTLITTGPALPPTRGIGGQAARASSPQPRPPQDR